MSKCLIYLLIFIICFLLNLAFDYAWDLIKRKRKQKAENDTEYMKYAQCYFTTKGMPYIIQEIALNAQTIEEARKQLNAWYPGCEELMIQIIPYRKGAANGTRT